MTIVGSWTKSRGELIIERYWWLPFPQSGQNIVHYFSFSFILVGTVSLHSWLSRGSYHQRRWSANSKKNDDHCRPMVSMMTRKLSLPKAEFLVCFVGFLSQIHSTMNWGHTKWALAKYWKALRCIPWKGFYIFSFPPCISCLWQI